MGIKEKIKKLFFKEQKETLTPPQPRPSSLTGLYGVSSYDYNEIRDSVEDLKVSIENIPTVDLTPVNKAIEVNRKNIEFNKNNLNNLSSSVNTNTNDINTMNVKVNKVIKDLSNANIASYKGLWTASLKFKTGDIVNFGDHFYLAVKDSVGKLPNENKDIWKVLTFTVDTSDFITDSTLTPLRNDITTNRNNISTNTSSIQNLSNRIDSLPSSKRYFDNEKWINFRLKPETPQYWTNGDLRTFEIGIDSDELIPFYKDTVIEYLLTATFSWYDSQLSVSHPISHSYYYYGTFRRGSGSIKAGIPVFYITVPTAWGTDIRPFQAFLRAKSYKRA